MANLDSVEDIKKIDKEDLLSSIFHLADQVKQAWEEVSALTFKTDFSNVQNIVVAGMGGSALGGRIIDSYLFNKIRIPIEIVTDFTLPAYVSSDSLVIVSSYSGGTAETLNCFYEAKERRAKIFAIATGGKLGELVQENNLDGYIFDPKNNPSGQPRMGLGYSVASLLAFLHKNNFVSNIEIDPIVGAIKNHINQNLPEVLANDNLAKRIAIKLKNKLPILVAGNHLVGISHAFKNQLNENAKTLTALFDLPELDHHLLEGLRNPALAKEHLVFLIIESEDYSEEIRKILPVVKEVITKNELEIISFKCLEKDPLQQIFEVLAIGSLVSYYLAIVYDIDPTPIPWVKYLKERIS